MRVWRRLWPRNPEPPRSQPQGEEYEIAKAERQAQKERDTFAESIMEKAGHAHMPYLKDPFD